MKMMEVGTMVSIPQIDRSEAENGGDLRCATASEGDDSVMLRMQERHYTIREGTVVPEDLMRGGR